MLAIYNIYMQRVSAAEISICGSILWMKTQHFYSKMGTSAERMWLWRMWSYWVDGRKSDFLHWKPLRHPLFTVTACCMNRPMCDVRQLIMKENNWMNANKESEVWNRMEPIPMWYSKSDDEWENRMRITSLRPGCDEYKSSELLPSSHSQRRRFQRPTAHQLNFTFQSCEYLQHFKSAQTVEKSRIIFRVQSKAK